MEQYKEPQYLYAYLNKEYDEVILVAELPSSVLEDDLHKYIGKIKLENDNGND